MTVKHSYTNIQVHLMFLVSTTFIHVPPFFNVEQKVIGHNYAHGVNKIMNNRNSNAVM